MTLTLHAAVYGWKIGGHQTLSSSLPLEQLPKVLNPFTDRPGGTQGIAWQPYFAGCSYSGGYALTYTHPDVHAARSGTVQTRVLLIAETQWDQVGTLEALFALLESERAFAALSAGCHLVFPLPLKPSPSPFGGQVVTQWRGNTVPVLVSGTEHLRSIMSGLWQRLPKLMRSHLGFQTLFHPDDLNASTAAVVFVPSGQVPLWSRLEPKVPSILAEPTNALERYTSGASLPEVHAILHSLERWDGSGWRVLGRLADAVFQLEQGADLRAGSDVLHLLHTSLSLDAKYMHTLRHQAVKLVCTQIAQAPVSALWPLASLALEAQEQIKVGMALEARLTQILFSQSAPA